MLVEKEAAGEGVDSNWTTTKKSSYPKSRDCNNFPFWLEGRERSEEKNNTIITQIRGREGEGKRRIGAAVPCRSALAEGEGKEDDEETPRKRKKKIDPSSRRRRHIR